MKTLILKVALIEEDDGRWSASVPALAGCSSWGYSKQEALENIKDAIQAYLETVEELSKGKKSRFVEVG